MKNIRLLTMAFVIVSMTSAAYADIKKRPGGRADRYVFVHEKKAQVWSNQIGKSIVEKDRKTVRDQKARTRLKRTRLPFGRRA